MKTEHTSNNIEPEKPFRIGGVMIVPYLLCAAYFIYAVCKYATAEENGDYSSLFYLIHGPLHEVGHFLFSSNMFPLLLHVAAGTLFQWLTPIAAGLQFIRIREFPALAVCVGWLGLSMLDTMVYMRDALELKLTLVSPFANGGEIIHDWRYIFQHTGTLKYTNGIANLTGGIGYLLVTIAVLLIFYMIARMAYEMFQKAIAPSSR